MRTLLHERISIGAVAAALVFPTFILEDAKMAPWRLEHMASLRLISAMFCLLMFAVNKTRVGERHPYALVLVAMTVLGLLKTLINPLEVQGVGSLYFGGHALLLVGALSLLPLSLRQAVGILVAVLLSFTIPTLILADPIDHVAFSVQNSLMATMGALLCVGCHLNYRMRFREFTLRSRLYAVRQRAVDYG